MSWQLFVRAAAEADVENLEQAEREALVSELFSWVDSGPPRDTRRDVLGVEMFDDDTPSGFRVTYVVDDDNQRILVVRIRMHPRGG